MPRLALIAPASRLAVLRVVLGVFLLQDMLGRRAEVAGLDGDFRPVGVMRLFDAPPDGFAIFQDLTIALAVPWILGVAWRLTAPLFAACFLVWATWRLSWGAIAHDLHLATIHLLALAASPAAATLSVDARRPGRFAWIPGPTAGSWHYGWPIVLLCVLTVSSYVLAGLSKVEGPLGWSWAEGENLLDQVAYAQLVTEVYEPETTPGTLARLAWNAPWIVAAGGWLTLAAELGAPLALLGGYAKRAWVLAIWGMHLGIALLMGITFPYQTWGLVFLPFLAVERVLPRRWR